MSQSLKQRLNAWQRRLSERIGTDISTPEARKRARLHYMLIDHGWLRALWHNFHEVAPGVWRSNQPSPARLRAIHAKLGLKAVLNLRGPSNKSFHLFEEEVCRDLGIRLVDQPLSATKAPTKERLEGLVAQLQSLPKPLLLHCKSGADRTGLAAAIYLLMIERQPMAVAMRQMSLRYTHVANSAAGIQDHLLRMYDAAHRKSGIEFADWVRTDYDPEELKASFARWRAGDRSLS